MSELKVEGINELMQMGATCLSDDELSHFFHTTMVCYRGKKSLDLNLSSTSALRSTAIVS